MKKLFLIMTIGLMVSFLFTLNATESLTDPVQNQIDCGQKAGEAEDDVLENTDWTEEAAQNIGDVIYKRCCESSDGGC